MQHRATQDGRVIVESADKTWSIGGENGKPLQPSCPENPIDSTKRQKSMDMNLSKLREIVEDGGAWRAAVHEGAKGQT